MRVSNLLGHKNQFIVEDDKGNIGFQSYDTYMAVVRNSGDARELEMKSHYWSVTTGKHMRAFLYETHMLDAVHDLIYKYKHFRTYKDFMQRANIVKVLNGIITVEYTDTKGKLITYICV